MSVNITPARGGDFATSRRGGLDQYEVDFLIQKAAAGYTDFTIANMLRRPITEIAAYREAVGVVPSVRRTFAAPVVPRPAPAPRVKQHTSIVRQPRAIPDRAKKIIRQTCDETGVTWGEMMGDRRLKAITVPRQLCYWRLWVAGFGFAAIGGFFGGKDHTSIRRGVMAHQDRMGSDVSPISTDRPQHEIAE